MYDISWSYDFCIWSFAVSVQCELYRGRLVLTNGISISSELLILYPFKICCIQTN